MRFWWALLPCPLLAGCLGYVYPDVTRTPRVAVAADGVRAFRAVSDVTMSGPIMTGPIRLDGSVEEVAVTRATVEPRWDASLAYYYLAFPFNGSRSRAVEVLLYRPGYRTVVIPARPWWGTADAGRPEGVVWDVAPDLQAQKEAIDRLVPNRGISPEGEGLLRFVAGEYARLAESPSAHRPDMAETRKELLDAARECGRRAESRRP